MGKSESEEREGNKEPMLLPKAHGDEVEAQETVTEARARVDKLWRTAVATGKSSDSGFMKESLQLVEMERHECVAKTESAFHPVEDSFRERESFPYLDQPLSAAYANVFYGSCIPSERANVGNPVRPTPNHAASPSFGGADKDMNLINLSFTVPGKQVDMGALLQQQLGNSSTTCPLRSSRLLTSIVASVEEAVDLQQRWSGSGTSRGVSTDLDEEEEEGAAPPGGDDLDLKAAITEHPFYPTMVLAHVRILELGAPSGLQAKLDDITKKFQRVEVASGENIESKLGQDPELDRFMKAYTELLTRFREDLEEPYNKMMQFMDSATKDLEDICGHYVDTKPEEEDNYGYDIVSNVMDGTHDSDELEIMQPEENSQNESPTDVDESIVVDPDAPEEELKKVLMKKYGRHIGGLKAEFNRVRKKGKLPSGSRQILKEWFNHHSYWPYPSEMEKAYLQRLCNLDLKQINNWFINERKRHWSSEDKCMQDPNAVYYDLRANPDGEGMGTHQEQ